MRVRAATPDDAEALRGVFRRSALHWDDDRDWLLERPEHLEWRPAGITRVAEDGQILGFATWQHAGEDLEVVDLFVDPGAMRRGVGRVLVADLIDEARRVGARALGVTGNPNALPFYLAVGFVVVGEEQTERIPAPRLRLTV